MSDGGMAMYPDCHQAGIVENAVAAPQDGVACPKVAALAAVEEVTPTCRRPLTLRP